MDQAAKAISRCYSKMGYARVKKAAEGGKHVVLLTRAGQPYVSVYDSNNAALDGGELKDVALAASKALKTGAVFTSVYDSDTYEFVVFANGRQIDLLTTDVENYDGPLKRLSEKSRAAKWSSLFGRAVSLDQIKETVARQTVFADDIVAGLSEMIGLRGGRAQMNYQDFLDNGEEISAELHFKKAPKLMTEIPAGEIRLADYFDRDNCRMRAVYPASWPLPIGGKRLATWLILSQGAGFNGGNATIRVSGPDTLTLSKAIISGCKFHNGQIVGSLEPIPPNLTQKDVAKLVDTKRFPLMPGPSHSETSVLTGEFSHLDIPSITPERTTQILVILQMDLEPRAAGKWEINVSLLPGTQTAYQHKLPPLRIAAVTQTWLPVVSGLNPKITYDKSNLDANHLRELAYQQSQVPEQRRLDHPAVTSSVAILQDEGQPTLDACKAWLEAWLRPLADLQEGEIRIHAEKEMSESAYVGKTKKTLPASGFLGDKIWGKLFDRASNYQTTLVTFVPKDAECAVAGIGLQHAFKEHGRRKAREQEEPSRNKPVSDTLSAMRGRPIDVWGLGETWHVFKWVANHQDGYRFLRTSAADMEQQLDSFAADRAPLQAWSSQCTWIPEFDRADSYERTVYEEASVLNWFRGILDGSGLNGMKMTAAWCGNVLRMVTPKMWMCRNLFEQVNRAALEHVAEVNEIKGVYRVALHPGCALDDLELALLPILPVESTRISVVS